MFGVTATPFGEQGLIYIHYFSKSVDSFEIMSTQNILISNLVVYNPITQFPFTVWPKFEVSVRPGPANHDIWQNQEIRVTLEILLKFEIFVYTGPAKHKI